MHVFAPPYRWMSWSPCSESFLSQRFFVADCLFSHVNAHLTANNLSCSFDLSTTKSELSVLKKSETLLCWEAACSFQTEAEHIEWFSLRVSRPKSPVSWWSSLSISCTHWKHLFLAVNKLWKSVRYQQTNHSLLKSIYVFVESLTKHRI